MKRNLHSILNEYSSEVITECINSDEDNNFNIGNYDSKKEKIKSQCRYMTTLNIQRMSVRSLLSNILFCKKITQVVD
jgi:hypothetical protein